MDTENDDAPHKKKSYVAEPYLQGVWFVAENCGTWVRSVSIKNSLVRRGCSLVCMGGVRAGVHGGLYLGQFRVFLWQVAHTVAAPQRSCAAGGALCVRCKAQRVEGAEPCSAPVVVDVDAAQLVGTGSKSESSVTAILRE